MGVLIDITGQTFGRLMVLERAGNNQHGKVLWRCLCNPASGGCGNFCIVTGNCLQQQYTKSCGCLKRDRGLLLIGKKSPMYGRTRERNPNWKGGRYKRVDGYIHIYQPDHAFANKRGYIFEHRLVCERIHKRYLTPKEVVHHINEIRDDNRPENLWIFENNSDHLAFHRWVKKLNK